MTRPTLTQLIFNSISPWDNPYQGKDKKVLFVCSVGILRSATAARIYADRFNTRACGSMEYALIPLSGELISWADEIVFMHKENYLDVSKSFDWDSIKAKKNVLILGIRDMYEYMSAELIYEIRKRYDEHKQKEGEELCLN